MRTPQLILGGFLILLGVLAILSQVLQVDFGQICWPVMLILLGLAILLRPRWLSAGTEWGVRLFGGVDRRGEWPVHPEEIWSFVGENKFDFRQAVLPEGETTLRLLGFVGDLDLYLPADLAYSITATAFVTDVDHDGQKHDSVGASYEFSTPNYADADKKVHFELIYFVLDLNIHTV